MEHKQLEPMKGKSGREPTAFTKKTIKELLAEEGVEFSDLPLMSSSELGPDVPKSEVARVLDHTRLQPLKGKSRPEPTDFTKKSIKELLADEGVDINDLPLMNSSAPAPKVEAAPHPQAIAPAPVTPPAPIAAEPAPAPVPRPATFVELAPAEKPRSFLSRLFGR